MRLVRGAQQSTRPPWSRRTVKLRSARAQTIFLYLVKYVNARFQFEETMVHGPDGHQHHVFTWGAKRIEQHTKCAPGHSSSGGCPRALCQYTCSPWAVLPRSRERSIA
jgi:hypothetical protein